MLCGNKYITQESNHVEFPAREQYEFSSAPGRRGISCGMWGTVPRHRGDIDFLVCAEAEVCAPDAGRYRNRSSDLFRAASGILAEQPGKGAGTGTGEIFLRD